MLARGRISPAPSRLEAGPSGARGVTARVTRVGQVGGLGHVRVRDGTTRVRETPRNLVPVMYHVKVIQISNLSSLQNFKMLRLNIKIIFSQQLIKIIHSLLKMAKLKTIPVFLDTFF